jgi:hypothetical protein
MKQFVFSALIVFIILISTCALAFPAKHWGLKLGYTSAGQKWEHDWISNDDISMRSGFHVGIFAEWFDYNYLSLTTGINYEQKGSRYTSNLTDDYGRSLGEQTLTSRLDYLSIPILAKYTKRKQEVSFYITAGPRFDIFLGYAKDKGNLVWGNEDKYKDVVFGLSIGFGLARTIYASREVLVEFIYNYDPMWLYNFKNARLINEFQIKNESFNISIGIGL